MVAIWYRLRAELRAGARTLIATSLLIGLGGAIVLGAVAAVRRTGSAFPRFVEASHAHDLLITPFGTSLEGFGEAIGRMSGVVGHAPVAGMDLAIGGAGEENVVFALVAVDERAFREIARPNVIEGRLPDPAAAHEIAINRPLADAMDVGAGDTVQGFVIREDEQPLQVPLTVAGVTVGVGDVVPPTRFDLLPTATLTPAAFREYAEGAVGFDGVLVRLAHGVDAARFERDVRALLSRFPETGGDFLLADERDRTALVERALRPQVLALVAFAVVAGLTVLLVTAQVLGRQALLDSGDHPALRALGVSPRQLAAVASARVVLQAAAGAAVAVLLAWLSSWFTPIGPSRLAETDPGLTFDAAALGFGALGVVVAILGVMVPRIWLLVRRSGQQRGRSRPAPLSETSGRFGAPASVATGLRLALDPGTGSAAVPIRSAVAGTLIALMAAVGTFTFASSLDRLVTTPRLYGQDWDLIFDVGFGSIPPETLEIFTEAPEIEAVTGGVYGHLIVEGVKVPGVGLEFIRGEAHPTLLDGRAARAPDEIVLGSTTLASIGRSVGDDVTVEIAGSEQRMTIVGRAVFPQLGQGSFTPTGLGRGAAGPLSAIAGFDIPEGEYAFALMRVAGGADPAAVVQRLRDRCSDALAESGDFCELLVSQTPPDIANYARIRGTPVALAAFLGLLAAATLGHALVTSVTRRRRDLAVLRTLGFVRGQLRSAVMWQAGALVTLATALGVPLGVVVGRSAWTSFAGELGVPPAVVVPAAIIAGVAGTALLIALVVSAVPARLAARTAPALVLRTE